MAGWPSGGIFNDSDDGSETDHGIFSEGDATDGPVQRGVEDPTGAGVKAASVPQPEPQVIPPGVPAGESARDVNRPARAARPSQPPAKQGIAMKVIPGPGGKPMTCVARTVNGRTVEAWRQPTAAEMAHVRTNGVITKMGDVPAEAAASAPAASGSPGWMTWLAVGAAVAGGVWWWTHRSPSAVLVEPEGEED